MRRGWLAIVLGGCGTTQAEPQEVSLAPRVWTELEVLWTGESDTVYGLYGFNAISAGDVDSDGFDDLLVTSPGWSDPQAQEGAALFYCGNGAGFDAAPAWTIEGGTAGIQFGLAAGVGDFNGDGYPDTLIGAPGVSDPELDEGAALVHDGGPGGPSAAAGWSVQSNQAGAYLGARLDSAGDVNGDGYDDAVVTSYDYTNQTNREGKAWAYHGSAAGLAAAPAWTAEGNQYDCMYGWAIAGAGDVNGDGYDDIIVGSHAYDAPESREGRAWVYHGSAAGLSPTAQWTAESNQVDGYLGFAVDSAGDVNGDGYDDVIVGGPFFTTSFFREGRAWVYHGGPAGLSTVAAVTLDGTAFDQNFGGRVAGAGDLNGDGYADVLVSDSDGAVRAYMGSPTGVLPTPAWVELGDGPAYQMWVAGLGDVNGDGFGDLAIADATADDPEQDEGITYVLAGKCYDPLDADGDGTGDACDLCPGLDDALYGDLDGDGFPSCGTDCWDGDATVFPGAMEVADGVDQDCDGIVDEGTEWYDDDGDGTAEVAGDCDDGDAARHLGAEDPCDPVDQDCDGDACEDTDGDGYDPEAGDCADGDPTVNPGVLEIDGNGVDDDCDGLADPARIDADGDGFAAGDCEPLDPAVYPGNPELANGLDDDCDGVIDEGTVNFDDDGDGWSEGEGDCHDGDPGVHPGAGETPDGRDEDCDGVVDEGTDRTDDDGDGFSEIGGDPDDADPVVVSGGSVAGDGDGDGWTIADGDCDDGDAWAAPDRQEMCDGVDNNCDGTVDPGCAVDTAPAPAPHGCATPAGGPGAIAALLALLAARRQKGGEADAATHPPRDPRSVRG
jgi:hypothetical protein